MLDIVFLYGWEPVLIHQILIVSNDYEKSISALTFIAFHLLHLLLLKILVLGCLFTGMIVFNFYTALLTSNSGEIIIIIWFIFEKNKHLKFCSVNTNTASKVEKFKDIANKGMKVV